MSRSGSEVAVAAVGRRRRRAPACVTLVEKYLNGQVTGSDAAPI